MTANVKLGLITVLILALIAFAKWGHDSIYDSGYNAAVAAQAKLNEAADKKYTEEINIALKDKKDANAEAARLLEELNNAEGKFREIQKATANSKCKSLGDESFQLFNEIIGTKPIY